MNDTPNDRKSAQEYLDLGIESIRQEKYDSALDLFSNALTSGGDPAEAYLGIGAAKYFLKSYGEAIEALEKALTARPDDDLALSFLGDACRDSGDYERATRCYRRLTVVEPGNIDGYDGMGFCLNKLKEYSGALEACDKAIQIEPGNARFHYEKGLALVGLKRPEEAVEAFSRAIAIDPGYSYAYYNRACAYMGQGNLDLARKDINALKSLDLGLAEELEKVAGFTESAEALSQATQGIREMFRPPAHGKRPFILSWKGTLLFILSIFVSIAVTSQFLSRGGRLLVVVGVILFFLVLRLRAYMGPRSEKKNKASRESIWKDISIPPLTIIALVLFVGVMVFAFVLGFKYGPVLTAIFMFLFLALAQTWNRDPAETRKMLRLAPAFAGALIRDAAVLALTFLGSYILFAVMSALFSAVGYSGDSDGTTFAKIFMTVVCMFIPLAVFAPKMVKEIMNESEGDDPFEGGERHIIEQINNPINGLEKAVNRMMLYIFRHPTMFPALLTGGLLGLLPHAVRWGGAGNLSAVTGAESFRFMIQTAIDVISQDLSTLYGLSLTEVRPEDFLAKTYYVMSRFVFFGMLYLYIFNMQAYMKKRMKALRAADKSEGK